MPPKRTDQHELEDISRAKFKLALPRGWVFRNKNLDYGIDGEVEIFDQNKQTTGLVFLVQLKATESESTEIVRNVDLKIDSLIYYKSLELPTILARYSFQEDAFYIKWVYNTDLFYSKKDAKTFRIKLSDNDKWNGKSEIKIKNRLIAIRNLKTGNFNFPIPYSINIVDEKSCGIHKGILHSKLRRQLDNYSDFVSYSNKENDTAFSIRIVNDNLEINLCDLDACIYHNLHLRSQENFDEQLSIDIILGLVVCFLRVGHTEIAGRLVFENKIEHRLLQKREILSLCLSGLLNSSYFEKMLDLLKELLKEPESKDLAFITSLVVQICSKTGGKDRQERISRYFRDNLKAAHEKRNEQNIGIAHYNLGNHLRSRNLYHEAIEQYIKAKRHAPIYLNQEYYFSEMAGCFFLLGKYGIAASMYKRSLDLGNSNSVTYALYADSLMFSGKYKLAIHAFDKYLELDNNPKQEFSLKRICLDIAIQKMGIYEQSRFQEVRHEWPEVDKMEANEEWLKVLTSSLEKDLLKGEAWFNLGVLFNELGRLEDTAFAYTMAALCHSGDVEAWRNASFYTLCAQDKPIPHSLVFQVGYFFNRDNFLQELYELIEKNFSDKVLNETIQHFEKLLPTNRAGEDEIVIRSLQSDGTFKNIFDDII